ncbi:ATP-binding protein [Deinococcus sp. Marseille-Q6407]|uniref:ATP-binding protein n=1 Tax=Deinococcus sp. Marseille-Q6407 TaxID=2969223 RepID=UPI0021C166DC|nr:ATP-binding protein [Deinococcus sp. Marseille-Q6407]
MSSGPESLLPPTYLGGPPVTGENCDREPIHIPGSIQPHGVLLVVQADSPEQNLPVLQASENIAEMLGLDPDRVLGQPLGLLLGEQAGVAQALQEVLPAGTTDRLQFRMTVPLKVPLALTAHRAGDRLVLEFEPEPGERPEAGHRLRNAVFALENAQTLQELLDVAANAARELSGFDRVMIYRFAPDQSGEVVAESRRADLAPFLGHRFPESDIPAQARALYVRHLLRLTADVDAPPSPLLPRMDPLTQAPTPLGGAVLRATSPMHLQYLRNMGVASSLSVSIVTAGRLWGLISCHHSTPHITPPSVRAALEELGRLLNVQVQLKEQADVAAFRARLQARHQEVLNVVAQTLTPLQTLSDPALGLQELLQAGGLALRLEGEWRTLGAAPSPEELDSLLDWLKEEGGAAFETDHLEAHFPPAAAWRAHASGLLAVSISGGWQEALLWFRGEEQQVEVWGGATPEHAKTELGPRRSFDTYVEQVRGHSRPWHAGEVSEAQAIGQSLSATLGERLTTLRRLNTELAHSNEEWRRFAFIISHDLQEPVRLIGQFTELFMMRQSSTLDEQTTRLLQFLSSETSRIGSLIADLYHYTELLSYPELRRQPTSLLDLLQRSLAELGSLPGEKQLDWQLPPQDLLLDVDQTKMQLALTHILRNALTFGTAPVSITVQASQDAGGFMQLSIRDNGPGIAPEYQERVFGLFQRLSGPSAGAGNGVGLTLARKVAELHGGTLTLRSVLGQGTTLDFSLPPAQGPGADT